MLRTAPIRRPRRRAMTAVAGSVILASSLLLAGCSLVHLPGVPGSDSKGGGISIPGIGSAGTGKLPKDFPSAIPVIKGDIASGMSLGVGGDKVWNVSVKISGVDDYDTIQSELTKAGFTEENDVGGKTDDGATGAFSNDTYKIAILVVKADEKSGWVANYTVTSAKLDG